MTNQHLKVFHASPVGPGRIPLWRDTNCAYPIGGVFARGAAAAKLPIYPKFRAWRYFDQGPTSRCTAFSSMTLRDCAEVRDPSLLKGKTVDDYEVLGQSLYEQIQRIDRERHGVNVGQDGGATMLAALKAGVERGWWGEYRWAIQFEDVFLALRSAPMLTGVNMYTSMYERDAEGIVRITPRARLDGGHAIVLNHYDAKRDLFRFANTWGTTKQDYWMPSETVKRLFDEDGEFCVVRELPRAT